MLLVFFWITFKAWLYLTFVTLPFKYLNAVFKWLDTTDFSLQSRKPDKGCYETLRMTVYGILYQ